MLEPYSTAIDASCARKALPEVPPAGVRPGFPDSSHPLTRIDRIVASVCAQAPGTMGSTAQGADVRVIRAAILQSLYSFGCNELLLEHLRYNSLYRWFVGLQDGEPLWTSATYADALSRILRSPDTAAMLRRSLIRAQSCAAICPDRFCVDRALIERWTAPARDPAVDGASSEPAANELCRARLERAREIILRRIGDHDLTPESIAAEMCMSRRALFLLFEKHGLTPTRVIRDLRLDHCRRLLADARHRQRKVTDIAMDFGFAHPGTFSRQFKDRFGVSPIEVRFGARSTHNDFSGVRFGCYAEAAGMS
jgi:AraC-like DNA-binding protein